MTYGRGRLLSSRQLGVSLIVAIRQAAGNRYGGGNVTLWWVNQKKTWRDEFERGVLWAPLLTRQGRNVAHWHRMAEVATGDAILHNVGGVVAWSRVSRPAEESARPYDAEEWTLAGRALHVETTLLDVPIAYTDIPRDLRSSGFSSPFTQAGGVKQGYLFEVPSGAEQWFFQALGTPQPSVEAAAIGRSGEGVIGPEIQSGPDRWRYTLVRGEQIQLRKALLGGQEEATCQFCGRLLPVRLLVAAHLKRRSLASKKERHQQSVVARACLLGCDALYEHGYISVSPAGTIIAGPRPMRDQGNGAAALASVVGRPFGGFTDDNAQYFAWHRRHHRAALRETS